MVNHYVLCRLNNKLFTCPFDDEFLFDLDVVINKNYNTSSNNLRILFRKYIYWTKSKELDYSSKLLLDKIICSNSIIDEIANKQYDLGLKDGFAGYGLKKVFDKVF